MPVCFTGYYMLCRHYTNVALGAISAESSSQCSLGEQVPALSLHTSQACAVNLADNPDTHSHCLVGIAICLLQQGIQEKALGPLVKEERALPG